MDAIKFMAERLRLCRSMKVSCEGCPLHGYCGAPIAEINPDSIAREVEFVEQWSAEHPVKTRLQDFLEKFPNAPRDERGLPLINPRHLGYCESPSCAECEHLLCSTGKCWNLPLEEE